MEQIQFFFLEYETFLKFSFKRLIINIDPSRLLPILKIFFKTSFAWMFPIIPATPSPVPGLINILDPRLLSLEPPIVVISSEDR